MNAHRTPRQKSRRRSRGLSLIELMIALTLGMFIVAGLFTLIARNSNVRDELDKASRQIENGRYAVETLAQDIRNAGFYGDFYALPTVAALPDPCSTTVTDLQTNIGLPVQGYWDVSEATRASSISCIPQNDFTPGSSILVVRYASPQIVTGLADGWTAIPTLTDGQLYLQSNVDTVAFAVGGKTSGSTAPSLAFTLTNNSAVGLPKAPVYRFLTRIYFLGRCGRFAAGQTTCTAAADNGTPVPSLRMVELEPGVSDPQFSTQSKVVANGIEVLEFDYGIEPPPGSGTYSGAASSISRTPALADWPNVVAVTISLVARNTETSPGYADAKTYTVGTKYTGANAYVPTAAVAGFKRHQFQQMVRVTNTSMRREK